MLVDIYQAKELLECPFGINSIINLEWVDCFENVNHGTAIERSSAKLRKRVTQFDMSMNFIKSWDSMASASKEGGFDQGAISYCCLGKYSHHKGYVWRFENE